LQNGKISQGESLNFSVPKIFRIHVKLRQNRRQENCRTKWIFGIILRQIAAPNQYLRSICAKNVRQILFESLFCAEDLSEIHPENSPWEKCTS
jgi:hypothetical protein